MRDYEFRGKRLDNGEWVYGSLTIRLVDGYLDHSKKQYYIQYDYMNSYGQVFTDKFEVNPSTIGQFTGLIDKNGKKIYEGDIIKVIALDNDYSQRWATSNHEVIECMGNFCLDTGTTLYPFKLNHIVEVIGNIHEKEK